MTVDIFIWPYFKFNNSYFFRSSVNRKGKKIKQKETNDFIKGNTQKWLHIDKRHNNNRAENKKTNSNNQFVQLQNIKFNFYYY